MLVDKSVSEILEAFASADPTPGGGSAAALAGALGASLLLMVAHMPKTKTSAEADRPPLDGAVAALEPLAAELRQLIDRDTAAYNDVVAAYRLPKGTDEEQTARKTAIQAGMRGAIETPLAVMRACRGALQQGETVQRHGNPNAASDVTVAIALLKAGVEGARANVAMNLGSVSDAGYVDQVKQEMGTM
jgi:formiminotetrahydrofolate cyclodeaminase